MLLGVVGKITRFSLSNDKFRLCFGFLRSCIPFSFEATPRVLLMQINQSSRDYRITGWKSQSQCTADRRISSRAAKSFTFRYFFFGSRGVGEFSSVLNLAIIKILLLFLQMCLTSKHTLNTHASSGEGAFPKRFPLFPPGMNDETKPLTKFKSST